MNETLQNILTACVPVICLVISAAGAYLVAYMKKRTAELETSIENETAAKYITMASEAVAQAVTYTAQTFVDALKAEGGFTKEKQLEAFEKAKNKTLEILSNTAVEALGQIYGDFDTWLETKIEQAVRETKKPDSEAAATAAASVAATIAATTVQQLAAEAPAAESVDIVKSE